MLRFKGNDLLVLTVLEIQGFKGQGAGFPFAVNILVCAVIHLLLLPCFCCEYLGLCCELFVIVNILVCAMSYLLLL